MAVVWVLLFKLAIVMDNSYSEPLALMSKAGININVMLMVLNLLPCCRWMAAASWKACCRPAWPTSIPGWSPMACGSSLR
jgi:3-hydroxyisobutyrate dehydrogenase-like beta-hydroxyacid dehydrogenase